MSERHDEHGTTPEGEPEGFIDRVKDFFGIRDEAEDGSDAHVEYADESGHVEESDDAVREADTDEYDRGELQRALDEAATDGQPNAEAGEFDVPIGQAAGRRADDAQPDDSDDSLQTERHTRHEVTRETGRPAAEDTTGDSERHTRHEVTRETGRPAAEDPQPDHSEDTTGDSERHTRHEVTRETGAPEAAPEPGTGTDIDTDSTTDTDSDEERARREEEFAREHDPEQHDVSASEEFRQPGDWTADEHGGPQVQDAAGEIHEPGTGPGGSSDESSDESSIEEVRDGGHGVGSAAPLPDGRQPFGHPVKAWTDTMTFVLPGEEGYDADPHEWFVDRGAAEGAGFRHAHGG